MSPLIKNIIRGFVLLLVQLFLIKNIPPLHQFIVPYLYFVFLIWLPFRITRMMLLYIAFAWGYIVDVFYHTPGLHTAACVVMAYLRPGVIGFLLPKDATEWGNEEPTRVTMGQVPYAVYLIVMTLVHHTWLILLEWIQFGSFFYFIGKLFATAAVSLLLIFVTDLLLSRNPSRR